MGESRGDLFVLALLIRLTTKFKHSINITHRLSLRSESLSFHFLWLNQIWRLLSVLGEVNCLLVVLFHFLGKFYFECFRETTLMDFLLEVFLEC